MLYDQGLFYTLKLALESRLSPLNEYLKTKSRLNSHDGNKRKRAYEIYFRSNYIRQSNCLISSAALFFLYVSDFPTFVQVVELMYQNKLKQTLKNKQYKVKYSIIY